MTDTLKAALLVVAACAFYAGAGALAKLAQGWPGGAALHPLQVTAFRFLSALAVLTPFLLRRGPSVWRTAMPLRHGQRVLLGWGGVTGLFVAVQALPLADAIAVAWSAPLFALAFAGLCLGERISRAAWAAAAVGLLGVVVVMRPTGAVEAAALAALAAAVFTGAEVATIRLLAQRDGPLTILALNNAMGAALGLAALAVVWVAPTPGQGAALTGVGVAMVAGQALFLRAAALAPTSVLAPCYYATILWSALIGLALFAETPGPHLLLGGALIAGAGAWIATRPALDPAPPRR